MGANTLTWEAAVRVYIAVLRNPDAGFHAIKNAEAELLRLAQSVDNLRATAKEPVKKKFHGP